MPEDNLSVNKHEDLVIKIICRILIPFIQLFALYTIAHGHSSAGGGFQGGAIFGASFILLGIAYGKDVVLKKVSELVNTLFNSLGVMLYVLAGLIGIFFGGKFLQYDIIPLVSPQFASKMLIDVIEFGIGLTVASIMITIFKELYVD